jgi:ubiquinone/menaquinone biosynthesis C-methylase UbiE
MGAKDMKENKCINVGQAPIPAAGVSVEVESHYKEINEFFNTDYKWWENVYAASFPQGFFSFEMTSRKKITLEILNKFVKGKASVAILECGCGPGGILSEFDSSGSFLAGVDINFNSLAKTRQDCDAMSNLLQADIEQLPFKNNCFDMAYCVGVLSYLETDSKAIKEIARVIKPGGKIIISVPNICTFNKIFDPYYYLIGAIRLLWHTSLKPFFYGIDADKKYKSGMIRRYRYGQLDQLYRDCGLIKKETLSVSFGPPTLWKKEIFPLRHAIRMSEALVRLSRCRKFLGLTRLANHWVTCLEKPAGIIVEGL